ncbi:MAG: hypothetical protein II994_06625 [Lachnospiraceae bacterium]|nr:hypothetical protein [Lachnospiraceae bacterium]
MDKYEYKVRADEIKELIAAGEYAQAAEIADTIDWRRVKSVMMLCTISDLYKINRRYEDAKDLLLLAYERRPGGRTICYSLCELSIKTEDFVQAVEYYKEYVQVAPKDPGRYILQYKLYEAQDVSLEERIEVLEELKKRDYREKWAYELAYLYHRIGLATRCVEECDELILWFGEGKYVIKAMELKMLHQPLTAQQQEKYDRRFEEPVYPVAEDASAQVNGYEQEVVSEQESVYGQEPYATQDTDEFDVTKVYGDAMTEGSDSVNDTKGFADTIVSADTMVSVDTKEFEVVYPESMSADDELDIHVKTMDVNNQYNTINLQAELAAGLREILGEENKAVTENPVTQAIIAPMLESDTESLDYPEIDEVDEEDLEPEYELEEMEGSEVFFGETAEIGDVLTDAALEQEELPFVDTTAEKVMEEFRNESRSEAEQRVILAQPPKEMADVLAQESDGQLSLVVPEKQDVEKQITGQMNIEDILAEWERMKRENAEKNEKEVRQHVLEQTGDIFAEFDAAVKDGLLEKLEKGEEIDLTALEGTAVSEIPEEEEIEAEDIVEISGEVENFEEEVTIEEGLVEYEELPEVEEISEVEEMVEAEFETLAEEEELEEAEEHEEFVEVEELTDAEEPEEAEESAEDEEIAENKESAEEESEKNEDSFEADGIEDSKESAEIAATMEAATIETETMEAEEVTEPEDDFEYTFETEELTAVEAYVEEPVKARELTKEERVAFGPYIQSKSAKAQLANVLDDISMAAYTGNVIITGGEGVDTLTLAKSIVKEIKEADSNFSGKVAKVSGQSLNSKDVQDTISHLEGGALIILSISEMNRQTADSLYRALNREQFGIIVIIEDSKSGMDKFLAKNEQLATCFTSRMDVEALSNDALVAFGKKYAREREYSISELGVLALHTRIEEMQTLNHAVTVTEVKELVDEAIHHSKKKTVGHFFDVLLSKRYDEEDMIILDEKDFY